MKRGFTLIELLAVIVILAIISLIVVPIVLNIVNDSKNSSIKESANIYIDTLEKEIARINLKEKFNPTKCIILDGVLKCDGKDISIDIKGSLPKCGKITIDNGKINSYSINIDNKLINKNEKEQSYIEDNPYCSIEVVELKGGLTPVVYENGNWVITKEDDPNWYDYDNQKWANAVILENGVTSEVGKTLKVDGSNPDVKAMLVYIPRYEYKIEGQFGKRLDGTEGTAEYPGAIDINFIPNEKTTATEGYIIPPGFKFGDKQLSGIWVGKFNVGVINSYSNSSLPPYILPNIPALVEQDVSQQFTISKLFNSYLTHADSHMMKNSEWATIAYLSQSIYGKYGNNDYEGNNKRVYYNNTSFWDSQRYTGRSVGGINITDTDLYPNENTSNTISSTYGFYTYDGYLLKYKTNEIDTTKEQNLLTVASTTGNIYGVYDMRGSSTNVMAIELQKNTNGEETLYIGLNSDKNSGFNGLYAEGGEKTDGINLPDKKYYDTYVNKNANYGCNSVDCFGHAMSETLRWWRPNSGGSFNQDSTWISRSDIFHFSTNPGAAYYYGTSGFRIAITDE